MSGSPAPDGEIEVEYVETASERMVVYRRGEREVAIAQNATGYAMLTVREGAEGDELERYYGLDMALDHVAEVLGVHPGALPLPDAAADMGI